MESKAAISRSILEYMSDGVMVIGMEGKIVTFNPAAAAVLGLRGKDVLGEPFARAFMKHEGNDAFNQVILDAVYDAQTSHNQLVDVVRDDGSVVSLSVTTSFMQTEQDGKARKVGVIAVFSDVTELKALRDKEIRLTRDLKEKHQELKDAYLGLEDKNQRLKVLLKRVQVLRWVATLLILAGFLGGGSLLWNKKLSPRSGIMAASREGGRGSSDLRTVTLEPRPISSSISLPGVLEPRKVENVVSPLSGKVLERHFTYGEVVERGQPLLTMQTAEIEVQYREAQAACIKAQQHLKEVENWKAGSEVQRSRRALTKARLALDSQRRRLAETERLLERGIIPESEYTSTREQLVNMEIDYRAAEDELESILEKGALQSITVARLEAQNARTKMDELEKQLDQAVIRAPVSGVVLLSELQTSKAEAKVVERGVAFEQGEIMLSIGDLEGLSVKTKVDEVDVMKVAQGQKVLVSGDAFAGVTLEGRIRNISSLAQRMERVPAFDIDVTISDVLPEHRRRIRLGMSADLEVIVYENPGALMVPIEAVHQSGEGFVVRVKDPDSGAIREKRVEPGITTLSSVEILQGLEPGDEVVIEDVSPSR